MYEKVPQETTIDGLLDRRVALEQPADGFRVAMDTVFLAAAVPARAGEKILDLGCGVGGAMLCLAARVPGVLVMGIEIQRELALLCRDNIVRNKLKADLKVQMGDVTQLSPAMVNIFHHVMMNPPYHDEARHDVSVHAQKRKANTEAEGDLTLWIASAGRALKSGGVLTLIHRADRQEEIMDLLKPAFGTIEICRLLPKKGAAPKRVVMRAYKATSPTLRVTDFILHQSDGRYTDQAEGILRRGEALAI